MFVKCSGVIRASVFLSDFATNFIFFCALGLVLGIGLDRRVSDAYSV